MLFLVQGGLFGRCLGQSPFFRVFSLNRHVGAANFQHFGLAPIDEVGRAADPNAAIVVAVFFEIGPGVGLQAQDPLVVVTNHVAGGAEVEVFVSRGEDARGGPIDEVTAGAVGGVVVALAVGLVEDVAVVEPKDSVVVDGGWVAEGG